MADNRLTGGMVIHVPLAYGERVREKGDHMRYQNGIRRDEPSLTTFEATPNGKKFALLECLLIIATCMAIVLIPILGLFGIRA
jgi:hypothetical protein